MAGMSGAPWREIALQAHDLSMLQWKRTIAMAQATLRRDHIVVGGSAGAVKAHGGLTLVQDPSDATYAEMPRNAIVACSPAHVATVPELAALLAEAVLPRVRDLPLEEEAAPLDEAVVGLRGLDWPPGATS